MVYHISTRRTDYLGKPLQKEYVKHSPKLNRQGRFMLYALVAIAIELAIVYLIFQPN